jgi:hypothetical protein
MNDSGGHDPELYAGLMRVYHEFGQSPPIKSMRRGINKTRIYVDKITNQALTPTRVVDILIEGLQNQESPETA